MKNRMTPAQRGITMVESLVALVVLSIGLLGIASLYVTSLRTGRTALIRTQAVSLVSDLGDRIRANSRASTTAPAAYDLATYGGAPATHTCVAAGNNCSANELAEDDLASWLDNVNAVLPGPAARVVVTAGAPGLPDQYDIQLTWQEASETFNYRASTFVIAATP